MISKRPAIFIVEDDVVTRHELRVPLILANFEVKTYRSASEFLSERDRKEGCLIVDVGMQNTNWLEFELELERRHDDLVILVVKARDRPPRILGNIMLGDDEVLEKSFSQENITAAARRALHVRSRVRPKSTDMEHARSALASLTLRERTIAELLTAGRSNKLIASELGISQRTVEVHRAHIKTKIGDLPTLVRVMHAAYESARPPRAEGLRQRS